jgi:BirA family biotin operon repressor/biotin-[acetyl-CoA-carboxylase] ligase
MADIDLKALEAGLEGTLFSDKVVYRYSVDSTNRVAKDFALRRAPEGTVVLAEEQREGRGRMGRVWLSSAGSNLTFSMLLRPGFQPDRVFTLTMCLALAAARAAEQTAGVSPGLKWPNDLYLSGKKLGGILTEFSVREGRVTYAVLGLGLNVNSHPTDPALGREATSIREQAGGKVDRTRLLACLLRFFDLYYRDILEGRVSEYMARWNELSIVLGRRVSVETDSGAVSGTALRIDGRGALVVRDETGSERVIVCGDVSLRM